MLQGRQPLSCVFIYPPYYCSQTLHTRDNYHYNYKYNYKYNYQYKYNYKYNYVFGYRANQKNAPLLQLDGDQIPASERAQQVETVAKCVPQTVRTYNINSWMVTTYVAQKCAQTIFNIESEIVTD